MIKPTCHPKPGIITPKRTAAFCKLDAHREIKPTLAWENTVEKHLLRKFWPKLDFSYEAAAQ